MSSNENVSIVGTSLFKNPGEKIRNLAGILFWATAISATLLFVILLCGGGYTSEWTLLFVLLLPLIQYYNCLLLYGFGQIIEDTAALRKGRSTEEKPVSFDDLPEL